nr:putative reverse transcriptase domain-containing protein [Tanacetum cinerariifolium]
PGKANVVADALSRKEKEPIRVKALVMIVHPNLHEQICNAQSEAIEKRNVEEENLGRLIKPIFEIHPNGMRLAAATGNTQLEIGKCDYGLRDWTSKDPKWQSERTIQTLEDMIRACVIDFGSSWDKHLPLVEFSYNNSYHASIKAALFEALYKRKCSASLLE